MAFGFNLSAQSTIDNVLTEVERNNTTLSAYRKSIDAKKIGNKTGITPQNPEVEFNYLFGNPSALGNRTDFSIKQSFDFPTAYSYKKQISDLKNEQAELEYTKQRNDVLYKTNVVCVKLTYYNVLKIELEKRRSNASKIAEAYKTKYDVGDINILDYNKAQINLLNITKELESCEIERNSLLLELVALNGGHPVHFSDSVFFTKNIPDDFEQWFAQTEEKNPLLQWIKQELAISRKQVRLNTAISLPRVYGGYMSEKVVGQQFQGITLGVTIPLWENKNSVKQAKAQSFAVQSIEADSKLLFYNHMKEVHTKAIALHNNVSDYRNKLSIYSNNELLEKALIKGEISLTEYLYELALYYENVSKLLEMEMSLNLVYAELNRYLL